MKRAEMPLVEEEMKSMTPVARCGIIMGIIMGLASWVSFGWAAALIVWLGAALATPLLTVARCEIRSGH